MDIVTRMKECGALVEQALDRYTKECDPEIGVIYEAMRYSLLGGGKRLRPFLVMEFAKLAALESGMDEKTAQNRALPYAAAIEMIHTYSLIHDDLPCMDNDNLRRGKPTNHIQYGYANALLAGDGLLTNAFSVAISNAYADAETNAQAVKLLAECAGPSGMVGGQVLDLIGEKESFELSTIVKLQALKTGELIRCASVLGCLAGGASAKMISAATEYAMGIGRAFQVVDDILDAIGDEATLGKPVGSDTESGKTTFLTFMTTEDAEKYAARLTKIAVSAIKGYNGSEVLCDLAEYLLERKK